MNFLDKIREASRSTAPRLYSTEASESFNPIQRNNYLILGNAVELGTEVIHKLLQNDSNGLSDKLGEQKLLRADIANLVEARIGNAIRAKVGESKGD